MQLVDRIEKRRFVGREFVLWLWFESELFDATLSTKEHGEFGFCGCAKVPGTPYCLSHLRRCYTVSSVRPPAGTDDPEIIRQEPAHA